MKGHLSCKHSETLEMCDVMNSLHQHRLNKDSERDFEIIIVFKSNMYSSMHLRRTECLIYIIYFLAFKYI